MTPPRDLAAPTLLAWLAGALMTSPGHVGRAVGAGRGGGGGDAVTLRCPRACFCNTPSHIVYCSRRGLSAIPPEVPADTLQLNLNGNLFTSTTITRSLDLAHPYQRNVLCHRRENGKGSPFSIAERRVPELIPVLGSQPAGDASHKPGGRLPLLSARRAVALASLKRAATSFAAW